MASAVHLAASTLLKVEYVEDADNVETVEVMDMIDRYDDAMEEVNTFPGGFKNYYNRSGIKSIVLG